MVLWFSYTLAASWEGAPAAGLLLALPLDSFSPAWRSLVWMQAGINPLTRFEGRGSSACELRVVDAGCPEIGHAKVLPCYPLI